MSWIDRYQLFLFDFDGLLVNTEELHYLAYKRMMAARGLELKWTFGRYCQSAHYDADRLRQELFDEYPGLKEQDPTWKILYAEKQAVIRALVQEGEVQLMPGAEAILQELQRKKIAHSVVTHSPEELVSLVRSQHRVLNNIPYWITRKDYTHAKPHPECYQLAIQRYSRPGDRVMGFEDTPRGLTALLATTAEPVLICKVDYPEIPGYLARGVRQFESLDAIDLNSPNI